MSVIILGCHRLPVLLGKLTANPFPYPMCVLQRLFASRQILIMTAQWSSVAGGLLHKPGRWNPNKWRNEVTVVACRNTSANVHSLRPCLNLHRVSTLVQMSLKSRSKLARSRSLRGNLNPVCSWNSKSNSIHVTPHVSLCCVVLHIPVCDHCSLATHHSSGSHHVSNCFWTGVWSRFSEAYNSLHF